MNLNIISSEKYKEKLNKNKLNEFDNIKEIILNKIIGTDIDTRDTNFHRKIAQKNHVECQRNVLFRMVDFGKGKECWEIEILKMFGKLQYYYNQRMELLYKNKYLSEKEKNDFKINFRNKYPYIKQSGGSIFNPHNTEEFLGQWYQSEGEPFGNLLFQPMLENILLSDNDNSGTINTHVTPEIDLGIDIVGGKPTMKITEKKNKIKKLNKKSNSSILKKKKKLLKRNQLQFSSLVNNNSNSSGNSGNSNSSSSDTDDGYESVASDISVRSLIREEKNRRLNRINRFNRLNMRNRLA